MIRDVAKATKPAFGAGGTLYLVGSKQPWKTGQRESLSLRQTVYLSVPLGPRQSKYRDLRGQSDGTLCSRESLCKLFIRQTVLIGGISLCRESTDRAVHNDCAGRPMLRGKGDDGCPLWQRLHSSTIHLSIGFLQVGLSSFLDIS